MWHSVEYNLLCVFPYPFLLFHCHFPSSCAEMELLFIDF